MKFGAGITEAGLTLSRYLNDTLQIEIDGGAGGSLRITSQFDYAAGYFGSIETISFADGSILDLTQIQFDTFGSDGDDSIYGIRYGGSQVDHIYGGDGNDQIYAQAPNSYEYNENYLFGQRGNDALYGGRGNDELLGGHGNDYLSGDSGDDLLNGGIGDDVYYGGNGQDTFVIVSGQNLIVDFDGDIIRFKDDLWGGTTLTAAQIADHASVVGSDTVFDFGSGEVLRLEGFTDLTQLEASIEFF